MRHALISFVCLSALFGSVLAEPLPDVNELRALPPEDAVVLDPMGMWTTSLMTKSERRAFLAGMEQGGGTVRIVVAEPGMEQRWDRRLAAHIDAKRYPILILTYRASGIAQQESPVLWLGQVNSPMAAVVGSGAIVPDGEVHMVVVDLRDTAVPDAIRGVGIGLACGDDGPATFELLALQFESDHNLPPPERPNDPEFTVRVVDSYGKPVTGATVTVDGERLNASRSAITDAEGTATVRGIPNSLGEHGVRISKDGMATVEYATSQKGGVPERIVLPRGGPYSGTVQDEAGKPIADATVRLDLYSGEAPLWLGYAYHGVMVQTDREGRWHSPALPVEGVDVSIRADHPDYAVARGKGFSLTRLVEGRETLTMVRGECLRGRVVGPDGQPVPGATVSIADREISSPEDSAESDGAGAFAFTRRKAGRWFLAVVAEGLAPMKRPVDIREGMEDVEIVLEKGNTICGRVVDPGGKPLAGVSLKYIDQANPSSPPWKGSTDAEGRFSWGGAPSHQVSLEVGKAGYIALYGVPVEPDGKEADIVLPYALRVHGTVTDAETGEPVPRCRITSGLGREGSSLRAPNWMGPPKAFEGGTYEMSFYWAMYGTVPALKVEADGYLPELIPSIPLQGTERPLDIQLRKGQGLAGVVLLPDGKPAADARVWLVQKGRYFRLADAMASGATQDESVVTGADGAYRFPPALPGFLLVASHDVGCAELDAAGCAKSPDLRLEPWGKVEGAYRPGGRPAVGTGVWIESHHSGENRPTVDFQVKVHCDDEGRFHLDRVLPGRARLVGGMVETSAAGAQANCGAECWVAPGQTLRINLGGTGRPVVGRLVLPKGSEKKLDWASGEGTLTCSLEEPPGMPSIPKEISDLPRKERRKRMSAWLETEEGKAYQDYRRRYYEASLAALKKAPTTTYRLKVAADGSFRLDDVPAGKHELRVHFLTFKQQGSVSVGLPSASYSGTVRVPEMPSGRSDEPLDLGTLVLKLED